MDSQIESARIQGKSAIVAAIITATITGIFSIVVSVYSYNHISYLLKSIDDLMGSTHKEVFTVGETTV